MEAISDTEPEEEPTVVPPPISLGEMIEGMVTQLLLEAESLPDRVRKQFDEPEEVDEPELDEPELVIVENDPLPIIELSDEVVEASDSITDEQLEDAGISRDDFEIGLQDMVDNPDDYMMDIEEVDSDMFEVEEVVMIDETIFNEQIEEEIEEEIIEDETIDFTEIFGPFAPGNDFGETDATPI